MIKLKNLKMKHYTKMNNGYFAVALDRKSRNLIRKNATMDVVNGDHITLAYKPDNKKFKKLLPLINKKVDAYVNQIRANKNIEAFWVSNMYLTESYWSHKHNEMRSSYSPLKRLDKGPAHITISHKKDFKPGDANTMFKKPTFKQQRLGMLEGKIKWIEFNNKKEKNDNRRI